MAQVGAKYSPCMRDDTDLLRTASATRSRECGPDRTPANPCEGTNEGYGALCFCICRDVCVCVRAGVRVCVCIAG